MYCGDETGAFIGDIGSHNSRFGYGGEDNPKHVVPSYVCAEHNTVPTSCYSYHHDLEPIYRMNTTDSVDSNDFLKQGDLIQNWDAYEQAWQSSFDVLSVRETLKHTKGGGTFPRKKSKLSDESKPSSDTIQPTLTDVRCMHPVLATTSGSTHVVDTPFDNAVHRKQMETHTEVLMESLTSSAIFIAPTPMLAAFCHGRQTCVVVDVGASGTRVTPVVDGLLLKHAQRRNGRGGDWLGNVTLKAMQHQPSVRVRPRYQMRTKKIPLKQLNPIFHRWALRDVLFEFRTSEYVSLATYRTDEYTIPFEYLSNEKEDSMGVDNEAVTVGGEQYELPDGTMVSLCNKIGNDLRRIPELFFTEDVPFTKKSEGEAESDGEKTLKQHSTLSDLPIHKLIHDSLSAVGDCDVRKELCGNIVLCGASSQFTGMGQRLSYEMSAIVTSNYKTKVIASKYSAEQSFSAWIGASVLTSLGSFQQLWLSKAEYDEYGASLAIQRFP